ncbi:MAG: rRNA maturation RNase YbeY [Actinomycetota bacterium]
MEVFLANEQSLPVDEARLTSLARHTLAAEDVAEGELSVLLVTAGHIKRLNSRFAGDDYPTDVLSFPMMEDEESTEMLGDVVVCPEVAVKNARRIGHALDDELDVLLVHGTLHLLGYDHQDRQDKTAMDRRMREILDSFVESPA